MKKNFLKIMLIGAMLLFGGTVQARSTSSDYKAGYSDGCTSAKGHYTRSKYKYSKSSRYHKGWLKGKRACVKTKRRVKHVKRRKHTTSKRKYVTKNYTDPCNTKTPWIAFRQGWDDGYRSAGGRFYVDKRGCVEYRKGWISGYRACHCSGLKKPDSYAEGYYQGCSSTHGVVIRDGYYYRKSSGYKHGWIQGYRDCRGIYR